MRFAIGSISAEGEKDREMPFVAIHVLYLGFLPTLFLNHLATSRPGIRFSSPFLLVYSSFLAMNKTPLQHVLVVRVVPFFISVFAHRLLVLGIYPI